MANASGLAMERLYPGAYKQEAAGVEYSVGRDGGKAMLHYKLPTTPPVSGQEQLQYFLGSGHLGLTYLYEKNGYWLESPVAYYERLRGYAMKPGLEPATEMPAALTLNPSCLRCHMSGVQRQVEGTDNLYKQLPFLQVGITCESCHGDAREHVASKGKAAVVNPIKLSPEKRDSTCIVCHLEGDTNVERRGKAGLDFKPGDDIRDYFSYFVYAGATNTKRGVSEIEQFNSSRCKIATGPSMSCMNCHDPHASPAVAERAGFYRAKCLTCHTQEKFATQHFPATPDCTGCHMPKTGSENIAHVAWTDHRIRQRPGETALSLSGLDAPAEQAPELVSILDSEKRPRDVAMAYYGLAVEGIATALPKALQLLTAAVQTNRDDVPLLQALGVISEMKGDNGSAAGYYRAVLQLQPDNMTAGTNLGTLLAKSGDLEAAAAAWTRVFKTNEDVPELGRNLAVVECRLGNKALAEKAMSKLLTYSPGLVEARKTLTAIQSGQHPCVATLAP
ncbi:tetratricopeptide repeat protein [Granulicella arctica]|uniref:tetratricopeptide repeat protein n=1 Tax=Granulicella arctica TaxID=940613 RepID=UPI0021E0A358|nr:multiheme c-type cytochrome [Granulicella arctica]